MFRFAVAANSLPELGKKLVEGGQAILDGLQLSVDQDEVAEEIEQELEECEPVVTIPKTAVYEVSGSAAITLPESERLEPKVSGEVENMDLDARGVAWDARVHASSKTKTKDGSWRARRGVDEVLLKEVESKRYGVTPKQVAEAMAIPDVPGVPDIPAMPSAPVLTVVPPPPPPTVPVEIPNFEIPPAPPVAAPKYENIATPPASVQKPAHTAESFRQNFVYTLSKLVQDGKLSAEYLKQLKAYFKVQEIWQLNEAQINEVFENFVKTGFITKVG